MRIFIDFYAFKYTSLYSRRVHKDLILAVWKILRNRTSISVIISKCFHSHFYTQIVDNPLYGDKDGWILTLPRYIAARKEEIPLSIGKAQRGIFRTVLECSIEKTLNKIYEHERCLFARAYRDIFRSTGSKKPTVNGDILISNAISCLRSCTHNRGNSFRTYISLIIPRNYDDEAQGDHATLYATRRN